MLIIAINKSGVSVVLVPVLARTSALDVATAPPSSPWLLSVISRTSASVESPATNAAFSNAKLACF